MTIYKPTSEWSGAITLPEEPSILRVNAGTIRLAYCSDPNGKDDGQLLSAGDSVVLNWVPAATIKMRAENSLRDTEVYIGPWWS